MLKRLLGSNLLVAGWTWKNHGGLNLPLQIRDLSISGIAYKLDQIRYSVLKNSLTPHSSPILPPLSNVVTCAVQICER